MTIVYSEISTCPHCKETLIKENYATKKYPFRRIFRSICRCGVFVEVKAVSNPLLTNSRVTCSPVSKTKPLFKVTSGLDDKPWLRHVN
jgi:hypothetical protein